MNMIKIKCKVCAGRGLVGSHVKDDDKQSGYRYVEAQCEACIGGVVLGSKPRRSKLGRIVSARVDLCVDSHDHYDQPAITLHAAPDRYQTEHSLPGDAIMCIGFQRHAITDDDLYPGEVDPHLDYGPARSCCYAGSVRPKIGQSYPYCAAAFKEAATIMAKVATMLATLLPGDDLAVTVDALTLLGVQVDWRYFLRGEADPVTRAELDRRVARGLLRKGASAAHILARQVARAARDAA